MMDSVYDELALRNARASVLIKVRSRHPSQEREFKTLN